MVYGCRATIGPEEVLLHTDLLGEDEVDASECIAEAFEIPCCKPKPGTANQPPATGMVVHSHHGPHMRTDILRLQAVGVLRGTCAAT